MNKVAKLVEVSFTVRVVVTEGVSDDVIIRASYDKLQEKLDNNEVGDNIVSIEDDTECPFDPERDVEGVITRKMLKNAAHYLCAADDDELRKMVEIIYNHEDEDEIIDYLDDVIVWEKVEFSFTCKQFIEQIGF